MINYCRVWRAGVLPRLIVVLTSWVKAPILRIYSITYFHFCQIDREQEITYQICSKIKGNFLAGGDPTPPNPTPINYFHFCQIDREQEITYQICSKIKGNFLAGGDPTPPNPTPINYFHFCQIDREQEITYQICSKIKGNFLAGGDPTPPPTPLHVITMEICFVK